MIVKVKYKISFRVSSQNISEIPDQYFDEVIETNLRVDLSMENKQMLLEDGYFIHQGSMKSAYTCIKYPTGGVKLYIYNEEMFWEKNKYNNTRSLNQDLVNRVRVWLRTHKLKTIIDED